MHLPQLQQQVASELQGPGVVAVQLQSSLAELLGKLVLVLLHQLAGLGFEVRLLLLLLLLFLQDSATTTSPDTLSRSSSMLYVGSAVVRAFFLASF